MPDKKCMDNDSSEDDRLLENRRNTLKKILAGSGTAVTAATLQDKWAKPVIESVILPVHAQTSQLNGAFTTSNFVQNDTDLPSILVQTAYAICPFQLCINVTNGVASVQVLDNGVISTGSGSVPFNITLSSSGYTITGTYDAQNDQITGTYNGLCLSGPYPPAVRSSVACDITPFPPGSTGPIGGTGLPG